ncbi:transmembrane amino acid transporter protein-domain-containing protein [Lipomyces tetrasporus]|uniref:Transmembrane amino acid transporter protein-domain-containing protein n=1 Tax=Lipomyces tetrasporus TaxID=54092 RepID=A0AAD7QKY4_9ASCO|nr:transmembrane amino acid transporter protein-domain-containing protein [Lipomyces tetrasporus]KAJ8097004.1 transmembrane amino acid transporter protein-domain-containing protein [Lipomyces tetrasporus]
MATRKSGSEQAMLHESHSATSLASLSDDDDDLAPYRVEDNDPVSPTLQRTFTEDYNAGQHESLLARIEAPAVVLCEATEASGDLGVPGGVAKTKNGMKMAFMNMANSIIGAGIIGQPYALLQCGLFTGMVLLLVLTLVIDWTIRLMVINAKLSGTNTYQATVSACFGRVGYFAISLAQGLFAFGGSIAFTVIIGDTIPRVIAALFPSATTTPIVSLLTERDPVMIICILFISFPLSLSKNIANLAKASLLALISMLIIIVAVIVEGIRTPVDQKGEFTLPLLTINSGVFQGIGVISFAFVCHHNSLLIYGALRKPTLDRFARVTHWSTGVSMIACMALALAGFLTFRDKTAGNVLNNFSADDIFINIARFCFGFNMLTTFPLEIFVCREVLLDYIYSTFFQQITNEHGVDGPPEPSLWAHRLTTAALTLITLLVALTTDSLGIVLEVVGSTSACMLAYILPPLCYLKLATSTNSSWKQKVGPIACVTFGITVMIASTALSIKNAFARESI